MTEDDLLNIDPASLDGMTDAQRDELLNAILKMLVTEANNKRQLLGRFVTETYSGPATAMVALVGMVMNLERDVAQMGIDGPRIRRLLFEQGHVGPAGELLS